MILIKLNKNNIQGFTLIEAIVSLALFAVAFSGLYLFFGMATVANNNSEKKQRSTTRSPGVVRRLWRLAAAGLGSRRSR